MLDFFFLAAQVHLFKFHSFYDLKNALHFLMCRLVLKLIIFINNGNRIYLQLYIYNTFFLYHVLLDTKESLFLLNFIQVHAIKTTILV